MASLALTPSMRVRFYLIVPPLCSPTDLLHIKRRSSNVLTTAERISSASLPLFQAFLLPSQLTLKLQRQKLVEQGFNETNGLQMNCRQKKL